MFLINFQVFRSSQVFSCEYCEIFKTNNFEEHLRTAASEARIRGCLHVKFHPGMKSSLSMVKCLLLFTRFCRDEISSRDEKKKKRRVNTSSRDEILKWACFFNFWRMYSSMFSKFSMFEHNESMNIMKHKASL